MPSANVIETPAFLDEENVVSSPWQWNGSLRADIVSISYHLDEDEESVYQYAMSTGIIDQTYLLNNNTHPSGLITGSYPGNANSFDNSTLDEFFLQDTGILTGSYLGDANSQNQPYEIPEENHTTNIISSDNPSTNEGMTEVDWNPFPTTPVEVEIETKPRDLTRYRKGYSFTRQQPVRIRIYRR